MQKLFRRKKTGVKLNQLVLLSSQLLLQPAPGTAEQFLFVEKNKYFTNYLQYFNNKK